MFPIPPGAHIEDFRAVLGGRELAGEILPRDKARQIYESLVRKTLDPALLEYYQRDLFRARVFPIPARGEVKVTIAYRQLLRATSGFTRLRYPLDTGRFSAGPYQNVRIRVDLRTEHPLRSLSSPSHPIVVKRRGSPSVAPPPGGPLSQKARDRLAAGFLEIEPFEASSSELRARIGRGEAPGAHLPREVWEYVRARGIYGAR